MTDWRPPGGVERRGAGGWEEVLAAQAVAIERVAQASRPRAIHP